MSTRAPLWSRLRATPRYAPELLAEAAVRNYGPAARDWALRMRAAYPAATPDGLARLAARENTRIAAVAGGAAMLAGVLGPLAAIASLALTQAQVVLRIAAAHGLDPAAEDRIGELLTLTGVHPDVETAEYALAATRSADDPVAAGAVWRIGAPLARQGARWAVAKAAARIVPGTATLLGAVTQADTTRSVATRAIAYYRGKSTVETQSNPSDSPNRL